MKTSNTRPHGIMFHHFYDEKHIKGQGSISQDDLAQIIEHYQQNHHILQAREWLEKAVQGSLSPNDVCLTFDDALLCQYEIALPVLESFDLSAFWFVYSSVITGGTENLEIYRKFRTVCFDNIDDFYESFFQTVASSQYQKTVEESLKDFSADEYLSQFPFYTNEDKRFRFVRDMALGVKAYNEIQDLMIRKRKINIQSFSSDLWMNKQQVFELHSKNHIVGLHSHTHPTALASLAAKGQRNEYETNYDTLNQLLNSASVSMSHPCNSYNNDTIEILNDLEIKIGFRSNMKEHPLTNLEFPREDHANIMERIAA
ncbi:polysaccharide deacetylase family protein [Gimesia aquarii]|uniref:Polysaccharide deacetylase n=1 Tax=Gimesia aquarii TaxID=2527964 RepID=A0A517VZR6_9PLAN|nr:polysaccharide deacetylase family protein [Gimesia aquarii]QDT98496.1 Polysaccharide deacetylase [Gimesia aquarii]